MGERDLRRMGERDLRRIGERDLRLIGDRDLRRMIDRDLRRMGERDLRRMGERDLRLNGDRDLRRAGERNLRLTGEGDRPREGAGDGDRSRESIRRGVLDRLVREWRLLSEERERLRGLGDADKLLDLEGLLELVTDLLIDLERVPRVGDKEWSAECGDPEILAVSFEPFFSSVPLSSADHLLENFVCLLEWGSRVAAFTLSTSRSIFTLS